MRFFLFLVTLTLFSGCMQQGQDGVSYDEELANACLKKAAIELKEQKGLHLFGTGGRMMDEIKFLNLAFIYYNQIDIEEGRELLISALNKLANIVNADERIRPYLSNYPFTAKNIGIEIYIQNPDGSAAAPEKLRVIRISDGILKYRANSKETKLLKTIYRETYEEALLKVDNNQLKKSA